MREKGQLVGFRHILLGLLNIVVFLVAFKYSPVISKAIAGPEASDWIGFAILLVPLVIVDLGLEYLFRRTVR
jgi:hypothetical protein